MGLLDVFKRRKNKDMVKMKRNGITFYAPKPITSEEYQEIRKNEVDLLESMHDFSTVRGINAIPVSIHKEDASSGPQNVTGRLEYYLMHKAGTYKKEGKVELALACYRKANALMPMSPVEYSYDTYMRLPRYLRKLRRFDSAAKEEAKINELFGDSRTVIIANNWVEKRNGQLVKSARELGTDLVEASYIRCCCAECAKYRERVYSLSGKDTRYPKLPDHLLNDDGCGISLFPVIDGVSRMQTRDNRTLHGKQLIRYSNRPFVDDRTPEELRDLAEIERQQKIAQDREICRRDYDWLWQYAPDICPKSFSGYMRMRNENTDNYRKIAARAQQMGRTLH